MHAIQNTLHNSMLTISSKRSAIHLTKPPASTFSKGVNQMHTS